ncbi:MULTISPECIES: LysR family transcriptional regulator [unclassified Raoultella]|uniref:LysR family transcriptional regulator n=1 Tax=unclassified Raoultella TaxID=2627600 RepID=UPI001358B0DA|nr:MULTISPECIES: LysR family transcriptional regulator [unclassified Raoultella]
MNKINLQKLKIVNAVIECESASKAATQLNISPSAISYTIKSLREYLGADIFIRTRSGLKPDDTAWALQERYREIVALNTSRKEFIIATYSLIELLLADSLHNMEDGTLFHFITMDTCENERLSKLKQREVDIDIGGKLPDDISIISKKYLQSDTTILVSENHSSIHDKFTLADWHENTHLRWRRDLGSITSMINGMDPTDALILKRKISWESPNLLTMAYLCANSDSIMIIPQVFVAPLQNVFPLKSFAPPAGLEMQFECYIHYHRSLKMELDNLDLKFI